MHKTTIEELIQDFSSEFNMQKLDDIKMRSEINIGLLNEWSKNISYTNSLPLQKYDQIKESLKSLHQLVSDLLEKKESNPLVKVEISKDVSEALKEYGSQCENIKSYNTIVADINKVIENKKLELEKGDLATEEITLDKLKNQKNRYKKEVDDLIQTLLDIRKKLSDLSDLKTEKKDTLTSVNEKCISDYQTSINSYLEKFNTDFRIIDQKIIYSGGRPSINYKIEIDSYAVELGNADTPEGLPSFKNTLSEGDKYSLAFAFFLAKLVNDTSRGQKIVIIDDPVNSFDSNRRNITCSILHSFSDEVLQMLILTHEPVFALNLKEMFKSNLKCYKLTKGNGNSRLVLFNPKEEFRGQYLNNYYSLVEFVNKGLGDQNRIAQSIRPILEGNLRFRFPLIFYKDDLWLGKMVELIRNSDTTSELSYLKSEYLDDLTATNDYSKKFHHDQNPNAHLEVINTTELKGFAKLTLKFCTR